MIIPCLAAPKYMQTKREIAKNFSPRLAVNTQKKADNKGSFFGSFLCVQRNELANHYLVLSNHAFSAMKCHKFTATLRS